MDPNPSPSPQPPETPAEPHSPGQIFSPNQTNSPMVQPMMEPPVAQPAPIVNEPPTVINHSAPTPTIINGQIIMANNVMTKTNRRFRLPRKIVLPIAVLLVLLGGSAAAYLGYYVPNKPQNVLVSALQNSLTAQTVTTTGTLNITSSGVSGRVDYTAKEDTNSHSIDIILDSTISGVKVPLELISTKGNLYFKLGDLSTVSGLISQFTGAFDPSLQQLGVKINKVLSNQWVVVDSTLIKEAKLDCLANNYPMALTNSDIQSLKNSYNKNSFATITSRSSDSVNGQGAYKYVMQIDDNKLASFGLSGSTYANNLNNCLKKTGTSSPDLSSLGDNDKTPLTLWVDKSTKKIVKYSSQTTAQDKAKKKLDGSLTGTISYGAVKILAPANAKPVLNLVNDLGLGDLASGFLNSYSSTIVTAKDTERKTDINSLQGQVEAYFAENDFYPTLADLNSASWRATNMKGLDPSALQDPAGSSQTLASSAGPHIYSYLTTPSGCDNVKVQCASYTLSATLDAGGTYVKQSLN